MKLLKLIGALSLAILISCCGSKQHPETQPVQDNHATSESGSNVLVAYFSATGSTGSVAKHIAKLTGADIVEIKPETAFTKGDLDWTKENSRSYIEMHDADFRPEIRTQVDNIANYDVIYLGYPIWWDMAPKQINSFIEKHDLSGKKVIPFATSGSSTIDNSVKMLRETYPDISFTDGHRIDRHIKDPELMQLIASDR